MEGQTLSFKGVQNSSLYPILLSLDGGVTFKTLQPNDGISTNSLVPDLKDAYKITMLRNNIYYVFSIFKSDNRLQVVESVRGGAVALEITGPNGMFQIKVEDAASIIIEDIGVPRALKYNEILARFYHFEVRANNIVASYTN